MTTLATSLLDFLMNLFKDEEAAAAFKEDPEGALAKAGLGDVGTDDVDAVKPVIEDYAPVKNKDEDKDDDKDDKDEHDKDYGKDKDDKDDKDEHDKDYG
ncbi:ABC-type Zn2+ transport system substrate-binding protein/surface adhesin, partial [Arthrobacter sp. CAN_A6]|uniref:IniB N-terminal domain-containing protein n=1 Tax=Arthrobacter sp. CAN_A6 TaxID=2787721 RepID=UPI0018CBF0A1